MKHKIIKELKYHQRLNNAAGYYKMLVSTGYGTCINSRVIACDEHNVALSDLTKKLQIQEEFKL